jgi:mRNA interferase MazF
MGGSLPLAGMGATDFVELGVTNATVGSEQGGQRPVLILQRSRFCQSSPTVIVAPITAQLKYPFMRAHHVLDKTCPLHERSMVLTEASTGYR